MPAQHPDPFRVAEIYDPEHASYGTAYLVSPRLLLTARHVVEDIPYLALKPEDLSRLTAEEVRSRGGTLCQARLVSKQWRPFRHAVPVWRHPTLDVALVAAVDAEWEPPEVHGVSWTDLGGVESIECLAIGFPTLDEDKAQGVHDTRTIEGAIPPATRLKSDTWAIHVKHSIGSTRHLSSQWSGSSGAAVFTKAGGLVGIVQLDADADDPTRLELWALKAVLFSKDVDFNSWLTFDGGPSAWKQLSPSFAAPAPPTSQPLKVMIPGRRDLVAREELMDAARTQLLDGDNVALLSGLPGVGKTSLAVNLAHDPVIMEHYPDGRLWLAVGKTGASGLSPWVNRLLEWGKPLGISPGELAEAQVSNDGERLALLIGQALGDRRALVVFDDVWEREDALTFRPIGENCARLLTTRIPKVGTLFSSSPIPVLELTHSESLALIEKYCTGAADRYGELLSRVVDAISGLPLTLVLVGQNIREQENYGTDAANEFLEGILSAQARLALELDLSPDEMPHVKRSERTLRSVVELSTADLSPQAIAALSALTTFPPKANSFPRKAAELLVRGRQNLQTLMEHGLVEKADMEGRRLTMHQALFDFARRSQEGDAEAFREMAEYFILYVDREVKGSSQEWVHTLEPEFENLRSVLQWAVRERQSFLGLRLMAALWPYWYERNLFQRARDLAGRILEIPLDDDASAEHLLLRAKVLNDAGNYAYNMADLDEAEALHRDALQIRQRFGRDDLVAGSKNNLGLLLRERGEYSQALQLFKEALDGNRGTLHENWQLWSGMNCNNLGITHYRLAEHGAAQKYQRESIDYFESAGSPWAAGMARINLVESLIETDGKDVDELLSQTLRDRWLVRDDKAVASAVRCYGELALRAQDATKARRLYLTAFKLSEPLADGLGEGAALDGLVVAAEACGDLVLGARAAAAAQAYRERSGVAQAPWRARIVTGAQTTLNNFDTNRFEELFRASYDVAKGGPSQLGVALGASHAEVSPEVELASLTADSI
jgi:tetratricopeptide (TPR) repeat protein